MRGLTIDRVRAHAAYELYEKDIAAQGKRRVLVPYYGGKVRMSRWLIPLMPPLPTYVEAFGGSAAVLLNRPRAEREIYADLNLPIATLVRDMRDNAERLIWELRYTPYSRRGYGEAKDRLKALLIAEREGLFAPDPDMEYPPNAAVDAAVAHRQGMNGAGGDWGRNRNAKRLDGATKITRPVIDNAGQGVDANTAAVQGINAKDSWARSSNGIRLVDGEIRPTHTGADVEAARQGVSADANTAAVQGMQSGGAGGWRHGDSGIRDWADGRQSEHITGAGVTANREGVSADGYETTVGGLSGRTTESHWRKRVNPPGDGVSVNEANRQGVAADAYEGAAADASETQTRALYGKDDFGVSKSASPFSGTLKSVAQATREGVGVDAYETRAHGHAGLDSGFGTGKTFVVPDGNNGQAPSGSQANRVGIAVDVNTFSVQKINGQPNASWRYSGKTDGGELVDCAGTDANRQGIAVDEASVRAQAHYAAGGWGASANSEKTAPKAVDDSHRQGVAADGYERAAHKQSGRERGQTFGICVDPTNSQAESSAAKQGVGADAHIAHDQSVNGGKGGFKTSVDGEIIGVARPETAADRQGVATDAFTAQGMAGLGARQSSDNPTMFQDGSRVGVPTSGNLANKQGVGADAHEIRAHGHVGQPSVGLTHGERTPQLNGLVEKQGIAPDAYESGEHGYAGKDGFGVGQSAHKRDDGGASEHAHIAANRQGVGADAHTAQDQSVNGSVHGFKVSIDNEIIGVARPVTPAVRQGVDAYESLDHSHLGMAGGVGLVRTPDRAHGRGGQTTPTHSTAARQGVSADASEVCQNSVFGAGGGFGVHNHWTPPQPRTKSYAAANRQGVNGRDSDTVLPPGWDKKPAGYVVPFSGAAAVETLISYPPTKCETVNDEDGTIYRLFKAAREYPTLLMVFGAGAARTVDDCVWLANETLRYAREGAGAFDGGDRLEAWQELATTFYGRILWRLKRAQVEDKPESEIRDNYAHPTSAVLESPADGGGGHYLGYCLPMANTPLYHIGERLRGVEVYRVDALKVIADFVSDPDALIYADPPYVHSTRRGSGDYEHEMTDAQHSEMLDMMMGAKAHILISGYATDTDGKPNRIYTDALRQWDTREREVNSSAAVGKNGVGLADGRSRRTETVWANYDLDLRGWRPFQEALF